MTPPLVVALTVALAALPSLPGKLPKVPPKGPTPQLDPQLLEPDCSATKVVQIPKLRMFGMAPIGGVDWVQSIHTTLDVEVEVIPRGIEIAMFLHGSAPEWGGTDYWRVQRLRWPVTPPAGCEVSHTSARREQVTLRGKDRYERVFGSGLVREALCMADTAYKEKMNKTGCREVHFEPITVHFRKSTVNCGTVRVTPPPQDAMRMVRVARGDAAFSSGESYIEIDVEEASTTQTGVRLKTRVTIEEIGDDRSRFTSDWKTTTVFDALLQAPGCKVVGVENASGRLRDRAVYTPNVGHRPGWVDGSAPGTSRTGAVKGAGCRAATGTWRDLGCMVNFNEIRIQLAPK